MQKVAPNGRILIRYYFIEFIRSKNPLNPLRLVALTISLQDLSVSQAGAGLGFGFSRPTPPVSKNRQIESSTIFLEN